jgi:hypothetical protein
MKQVRFYVVRDRHIVEGEPYVCEEDRAMAHASIYGGESLEEAQIALFDYIVGEAEFNLKPIYRSAKGVRRAAELLEAAEQAKLLAPEEAPYARAEIVVAGLVFQIIRQEREIK